MKAKQPKWLKESVFYEIYPQSFMDTNGDGIGDIEGIIKKLDYVKELGCNGIWLNPCFASPFGDAGYDVSDFYLVAPRYGTNEDLERLFKEAHKRNMHIILDLVAGHTSLEHEWFKESKKAEENEYTHRYIWTDNIWNSPQNLATIRGISERDGSCIVNFFSSQPALNYGFYDPDPNEKWQQSVDDLAPVATLEELKNIMRFWLNLGCDGFRVDMAGCMVKNDPDQIGTIKLWQKVRAFLDLEYPNAVIISEWGQPDKALEGGFNMDFLLHFGPSHYMDLFRCENPYFSKSGKGEIAPFIQKYMENYKLTKDKGLICIPSGNHDMDRLARRFNPLEIKIAFAFLLSMPGCPFIYYGDEIGMRHVENLVSVEGGYSRTGARSPMQWDSSKNAGFSTAEKEQLYIKQDESCDRPTVENQLSDNNSVYNEVKRLIKLRKENSALNNLSDIEFVKVGYPLIYKRSSKEQQIAVIINPSNKDLSIKEIKGKLIYQIGEGMDNGNATVKAQSAVFIEL